MTRNPFHLLGVVALWTGIFAVATAEQVPFWEAPTSQLDLSRLIPATVELIESPDVSRPMATFLVNGRSTPTNFVPTSQEIRPYIPEETQPWAVLEKGLRVGAVPYGDRKYTVVELPEEFEGLTLLRTGMGQKAIVDARYFGRLKLPELTYVFLAIDERIIEIYKEQCRPLWLDGFAPTGQTLRTDEPVMKRQDKVYLVFVKEVPAGTFTLGPACTHPGDSSMYFAFFGARP